MDMLGQASNITVLAPNNEALMKLMNSSMLEDADMGMVPALLMYHVLNGTYMSDNVTDTPMFLPTMLMNSTYANVTDGQVVEVMSEGDTVSFYSALKAQSNVTEAVSFLHCLTSLDHVFADVASRISSSTAASSTSSTRCL